jgi:prolyl-tRNA synthetase
MLNSVKPEIREAGFSLYGELSKLYEVILDDRDTPAGVQFADADLLGIPLRLIVSPRNLEAGVVELVSRDKTLRETVTMNDIGEAVARLLDVIK